MLSVAIGNELKIGNVMFKMQSEEQWRMIAAYIRNTIKSEENDDRRRKEESEEYGLIG